MKSIQKKVSMNIGEFMDRIKILQIGAENFGHGGRSVIAYGLTKYMSLRFRNDFLAYSNYTTNKVTENIENRGKIFKILKKKTWNTIKLSRSNKYDLVHIHADNAYEALKMALLVKLGCHKTRVIVHAHTISDGKISIFKKVVIYFSGFLLNSIMDLKIAVSNDAAMYMFKSLDNVLIVKDGIDIDKFKYNPSIRKKIRDKFKIDSNFIIGNVGRLAFPKNQLFLVDIFRKVVEILPNARLILIGDGEDRKKIVNKVKRYGISDKVTLLGNRDDVSQLLQAMDVFVFPSVYEGFGMASLESQAAGLPTLISDSVPQDVKISDLCKSISLNSIEEWVNEIVNSSKPFNRSYKSNEINEILKSSGYNLEHSSKLIECQYSKLCSKKPTRSEIGP